MALRTEANNRLQDIQVMDCDGCGVQLEDFEQAPSHQTNTPKDQEGAWCGGCYARWYAPVEEWHAEREAAAYSELHYLTEEVFQVA